MKLRIQTDEALGWTGGVEHEHFSLSVGAVHDVGHPL